jgi:hypothetical protein
MDKLWVIVKFKDNHIEIWRDYYDDFIWGSPLYQVCDYFQGSFKQAREFSKQFI